ncbi:hypothetical protein NQ318_009908 [Aromia moschata]|uniref:Origin recognition complex subunit 3 n=1 Tax=Aromia moschata TaxID=1265417 RepID=A0AAV8YC32_9CUCU|nr:hypothetical protein NQ318_009908 [Aromia moschata]
MGDQHTVSVSKGVFVFKNNFKPSRKKKHKMVVGANKSIFSNNLWYQSYFALWKKIEQDIEELNVEMLVSVLSDLMIFIKNSHDNGTDGEIPTAALLTGINMPDHEFQFKALSNQIKLTVSPHVSVLHSQDCQNLKYLIENMVNQFINEHDTCTTHMEMEEEDSSKQIKKSLLNLPLLQSWYEDLYKENISTTPKKHKSKTRRNVLVVIIPDLESFSAQVLQKFILLVSWYVDKLPFVFVFGIATSINTLHTMLPYKVSSKINIRVFNSQPSLFALSCPFKLGGRVFNLLIDIFLFYDFSVSNFIQNIKFAMAEHFSQGNARALCTSDSKEIKRILQSFTHEDCENEGKNETYQNRIKLLSDDEYFKSVLEEEITKIRKCVRRLHVFLKCLHFLVNDLPKAPLGKQVRELYSLAVSTNITKTPEYKECFQLLGFQSKEELTSKLSKIMKYVSSLLNDTNKPNKMKIFMDELNNYWNEINNLDMNTPEDKPHSVQEDNLILGQMDRKQLKEKLLGMSKQTDKRMNRYENLRKNILNFLSGVFEEYLIEPSSLYFHEIFFFNHISIQNYIVGTHRSAIHNALNDPQYYLQCKCCEIPNSLVIRPSMPDICITYKLHLECGKMINLYDWLQAFLSIVDPMESEDDSKRIVDPELQYPLEINLQARFTQAITELEFLGFVKSSKRKADHVSRLTWGG